MKLRSLWSGFLIIALFAAGPVSAANYKIDSEGQHAFVTFKVSHLGYSYIVGGFNDFEGEFFHDASNPSASKVSVTIDAGSLDTAHAERDKHLRSADFFDVGKYPTITFESTGYVADASGDKLRGQLTIQDKTREVELNVRQIGEGKDPWGGYRNGFHGTVTLNSADFGMPKWVGDVEVELNIEGIRL